MKICNIVGTRPQFIKYAMMEQEFNGHKNILVHSGQHYDKVLYQQFFDELLIRHPDYNIGIGSGNYGWQVGELVKRLYDIIKGVSPDVVLVYGDCNTTYAGAVATNLCHLPLAHVESGLRCFNWRMIEEFNRVQTDHCSRFCFAPTETAMFYLEKEGLGELSYLVGDLHYDSYLYYKDRFAETDILDKIGVKPDGYYLSTIHRAETLDDPDKLIGLFDTFNRLKHPVLLVMHPHLKKVLGGVNVDYSNILVHDAVGYLDMQRLLKNCRMVLTDSGGLTTEAFFHQKKTMVLREQFEYNDIPGNMSVLVGTDGQRLYDEINNIDEESCPGQHLFGMGDAAEKIMMILEEKL